MAAAAGALVGFPVAALYRDARRLRLRETLGELPPAERREALAALQDSPVPDARQLARTLLQECDADSGPSRSPPPGGREDKASPAG